MSHINFFLSAKWYPPFEKSGLTDLFVFNGITTFCTQDMKQQNKIADMKYKCKARDDTDIVTVPEIPKWQTAPFIIIIITPPPAQQAWYFLCWLADEWHESWGQNTANDRPVLPCFTLVKDGQRPESGLGHDTRLSQIKN